jgi:hypothetical protein
MLAKRQLAEVVCFQQVIGVAFEMTLPGMPLRHACRLRRRRRSSRVRFCFHPAGLSPGRLPSHANALRPAIVFLFCTPVSAVRKTGRKKAGRAVSSENSLQPMVGGWRRLVGQLAAGAPVNTAS